MLASTLIFLAVIHECLAVLCGSGWSYKVCTDYCCGYNNKDCCYYTSFTTYYTWGIGTIVGISIGGLVGLIVLIVIIVAIVKACTKSGTHGRVVQPYNNPQTGVIMTTVTQPGYSGPYPGPQPMYPPPPPAYTGPKPGAPLPPPPPPPTS